MAIKTVAASTLLQDFNIYPRSQVDSYHVREITEALKAGATLPPIIADASSLRIVDGFHRLRAHQRVGGANVKLKVDMRTYANEAAIFAEAVALNSAHGRILTAYDKSRCLQLGQQLGIERDALAGTLNITRERADELLLDRVALSGETLKRTVAHLAGEHLTDEQSAYNKKAGGMDQLFYINQVVALLEADAIDWDREIVGAQLRKLSTLLKDVIIP
jgi:hypothetical protein